MRKTLLRLALTAGASLLGIGAVSAFPVAPLGEVATNVEQVRVVCDQWGRCWRTGPRYRYGYYGPRRYGHYGYYGRPYGYYGGPYAYGPGIGFGGPGFGFRFGF